MADRVNEPKDQPKVDRRENLLFLLQKLAGVAEFRDRGAGVRSEGLDDLTAEPKANGTRV